VAVSGAANDAWLSHGVTLNFTATASPLSGVWRPSPRSSTAPRTRTRETRCRCDTRGAQRHARRDVSRDPTIWVCRAPTRRSPFTWTRPGQPRRQGRDLSSTSVGGAEVPDQRQPEPQAVKVKVTNPLPHWQSGEGAESAGPEGRRLAHDQMEAFGEGQLHIYGPPLLTWQATDRHTRRGRVKVS